MKGKEKGGIVKKKTRINLFVRHILLLSLEGQACFLHRVWFLGILFSPLSALPCFLVLYPECAERASSKRFSASRNTYTVPTLLLLSFGRIAFRASQERASRPKHRSIEVVVNERKRVEKHYYLDHGRFCIR